MRRAFGRASTWLLLLAGPVCAQFAELAATDDATQLFFTTSKMQPKGVRQPGPVPESRLYRSGADGVTVFAERGALASTSGFGDGDGIYSPRISGDGSIVGFTYVNVCGPDPGCSSNINKAVVRGGHSIDFGNGTVQISRDGKWALLTQTAVDYRKPQAIASSFTGTLVNLATGDRFDTPAPASTESLVPFTLASGGVVLVATSRTLGGDGKLAVAFALWKAGQSTPLVLPQGVWPVALSDDASTVVCYRASTGAFFAPTRILALDVASGKSAVVYDGPLQFPGGPKFLGVTNDGKRVLYQVAPQEEPDRGKAFLWSAGQTMMVPLPDGELATDGTLSGLGDYAFVATTRSRILKFAPATGAIFPLFPEAPHCDDPGAVAAGSMVRLHCSFSEKLTDLHDKVRYEGAPVPVLDAGPETLVVQIPWEWDRFTKPTIEFDVAGAPFPGLQPLAVFEGAPAIVSAEPGQGDTVNIYMTGLGPTKSREQTGVPASRGVPNPIQWDLACRWAPQDKPATLLFAGLAPGTIGLYQATFRVPDGATAPLTGVECTLSNSSMSISFRPGEKAAGMFSYGVANPLR
jgi:uncharacterized protein (TIGR03437 family)